MVMTQSKHAKIHMDKHRDNKTGRFKEKRMEELST
jgi:hypothetical protein